LKTSIAAAHRGLSKWLASRIRSARRRITWVDRLQRGRCDHIRLSYTVCEWISFIVGRARADGMVRDDLTAGVHATPSRTGINTALVEAGPVLGTV
jgi:hypothetical protein